MMNWVKLGCFSVQSQTIFPPNFSFYFLFLGVALSNYFIFINHSTCNNPFYGVLNYIYTSEGSLLLLLLLIFFFFFFFFLSEGCIELP